MRAVRRAIAAGGALAATPLLVAACGSTNYNTDLGALAGAVQDSSHGQLARVTCAGVIPYERQKKLKERIHSTTEYRYYCKGETAGSASSPKSVTKVIRVSADGKHWHEDTREESEASVR